MKKEVKTKSIVIDLYLSVWTQQTFEVPLDYEITESTPAKAYENLIQEFEDQNSDANEDPWSVVFDDEICAVDLYDFGDFTTYVEAPNRNITIKKFLKPVKQNRK